MFDYQIDIEQVENTDQEPKVAFVVKRNDEEVLRNEARFFSEDDMIAASNQIAQAGNATNADIDQIIAGLIEPIRIRWLRAREEGNQAMPPDANPQQQPNESLLRYAAVFPGADEGNPQGEPCIRDLTTNRALSNFVLIFTEEIEMKDDIEPWQEFRGTLTIFNRSLAFQITATDYADNNKLKAALYQTGGCGLAIHCTMDELRRAISTISGQSGQLLTRRFTTNFGWTEDRTAYLTPTLQISKSGIELVDDKTELRVQQSTESPACYLDMKKLEQGELNRVKQHIVDDLLKLNDPMVTYTLLGAAAAAILYPFTKNAGRFALWLVGQTGSGKSFSAKLFMNFFGAFPIATAPFTSWSATPNYVQRHGYYYKDAMYLVDDYKPELFGNPAQLIRVLQNYADNTARGRLNADATANVVRPIRGLLTCTGEDVPEHNASATARSIIIKMPQQNKNLEAGRRCMNECENYSGVTADFIRWLIQGDRAAIFVERFETLQTRYFSDVAGQQNDIRIATNLAQLGAAFEMFAEYFGDVWPEWKEASRNFVDAELITLRDQMLGEAKEQQSSEIFLKQLNELITYNHVQIDGYSGANTENKPKIGRVLGRNRQGFIPSERAASGAQFFEISMSLALAEVNQTLRQQGRPELRATESNLLAQLREDGKLFDKDGQPIARNAKKANPRTRLNGVQIRVFIISRQELLG